MPRAKSDFDRLYTYEVYEPAELFDPDEMYTVQEVARLLQDLPPDVELDPETEERVLAWTIPWLFANRERLVISDPVGDEPGYFGLRTAEAEPDAGREDEAAGESPPVDADRTGPDAAG